MENGSKGSARGEMDIQEMLQLYRDKIRDGMEIQEMI